MRQVYFGTISSYGNLGLFLTGVTISPPEPRRVLVDIPGRDGSLELEYIPGGATRFKDRKIQLEFALAEYGAKWQEIFSRVMDAIHGRRMEVKIEPDTDYYWKAFCRVSAARSSKNLGTIVVELDCFPYRLKSALTTYTVVATAAGRQQTCVNARMPAVPTFQAVSKCTLIYGNITKDLPKGSSTFDEIEFSEGNNMVTIKGTGNVIISYREGRL